MDAINYQILKEEYVILVNGVEESVSENIYELIKSLDNQTVPEHMADIGRLY